MAKAPVLVVPGTATARNPVSAVGSIVVVPQLIWLGLNVIVATRFTVTALLVPVEVTIVTLTVPGTVKFVTLFPAGTTAMIPVSDHAEVAGVTLTEMLPCVNTTLPGAA